MIIKRSYLIYALIAIVIIAHEWIPSDNASKKVHYSSDNQQKKQHSLQKWEYHYDDSTSDIDADWGIAKKVSKVIETNATQMAMQKKLKITADDTQNRFCINDSCYRILGIHSETDHLGVTLYNTDTKPKLQTYAVGESLEHNISISKLTAKSIVFTSKESNISYCLELFEVNTTKYKPKDINETLF